MTDPRPVRLLPAASEELAAAMDWYGAREMGLGDRLLADFERLIQLLTVTPMLGAAWGGRENVRRVPGRVRGGG